MTTTRTPFSVGSRIEFGGRVGTMISFMWDVRYTAADATRGVYDKAWKVVFDDDPETFVRIADEDKAGVRDISAPVVDASEFGRRVYTVEFPDGVHTVTKKGAYWFHVAPGAKMPGKKDFRGGSNTRADAVSDAFRHWAHQAQKPAQAAKDARRPRW
jgi:hypothetical protein